MNYKNSIIIICVCAMIVPVILLLDHSEGQSRWKTDQSADVIDTKSGEYVSPGNTWIEFTYSPANPAPWETEFQLDDTEKFNITVLDVIKSDKYAQFCEMIVCISGTYHFLVPNEDYEKFKKIHFGVAGFGGSDVPEHFATRHDGNFTSWEADKISLSPTGDLELKLQLTYDSEIPEQVVYYCHDVQYPEAVYYWTNCDHPTNMPKDLYFVDSLVFLTYLDDNYEAFVLGKVADSESPKHATVEYSGALEFPESSSPNYSSGSIGIGWVRILEDLDGVRYYEWMRSDDMTAIEPGSTHTASGEFSAYYPYPEFVSENWLNSEYILWV